MKAKLKLLFVMLLCFAVEAHAAQVVNIQSVIDDFINNPIKASQVWEGQEIYASGDIAEIRQGAKHGEFVIRIKADRTNYLDCYLAQEALSAAADLAKGQAINIRGVISGFERQRDSIIIAYNSVIVAAPKPEPKIKQAQQAEAESKEPEQAQHISDFHFSIWLCVAFLYLLLLSYYNSLSSNNNGANVKRDREPSPVSLSPLILLLNLLLC